MTNDQHDRTATWADPPGLPARDRTVRPRIPRVRRAAARPRPAQHTYARHLLRGAHPGAG